MTGFGCEEEEARLFAEMDEILRLIAMKAAESKERSARERAELMESLECP